jgi:hypothetical protein
MSTLNSRAVVSVTAHTADYTLTANDNGTAHSSKGASGTIVASLPAATVGLHFRFYVGAAQEHRIDPSGTEKIALPSTGVAGAAGKYLSADAIGENVSIICFETGIWSVVGYTGTWTAEG